MAHLLLNSIPFLLLPIFGNLGKLLHENECINSPEIFRAACTYSKEGDISLINVTIHFFKNSIYKNHF